MEASELKEILGQHNLWLDRNGGKCANLEGANLHGANLSGASLYRADLTGADLRGADLRGANLTRANLQGVNLEYAILTGAKLRGANLTRANLQGVNLVGAILPDISWIIPGCLVQLNHVKYDFYLEKERKRDNFIQDSIGFFIQDNVEEKTFDMLVGDRIIRGIPDWVKYSGLRQTSAEPI